MDLPHGGKIGTVVGREAAGALLCSWSPCAKWIQSKNGLIGAGEPSIRIPDSALRIWKMIDLL